MNKKGFTLIELLVVLAIMSLLALIIVPSINELRQSTLKQTYDNKIKQINTAAREWGSDNLISVPSHVSKEYTDQTDCDDDCVCVSINELVHTGYLSGDKDSKQTVVNPLTNDSMNSLLVCVRYDTNDINKRQLTSYIVGD